MIYYFSGNGNSAHVAHQLARLTHDRARFIPRAGKAETTADIFGLVFPIHAWGMPRAVEEFLRQLRTDRTPYYIYMVCTCGDDIGRTDRLLARTLKQKGLPLDAAFSVRMPNTYVALPGFEVDSKELAQEKLAAVPERLAQIAAAINGRARGVRDVVPGAMPWLKSKVLRPLFYRLFCGDHGFRTTEACNGCGRCAKVCPVRNIRLSDQRPQWQGRCTDCLACFHHCPQRAIRYGRWTEGKGQWTMKQEQKSSNKNHRRRWHKQRKSTT